MKMNNGKSLNKSDINKVCWRWILNGESGWTYEKMQGLCYAYTMMPALKKMYKDDDELNMAIKNHLQFFNCNPTTAQFVLGANLAIEEESGIEGKEAIAAIKTGLMGPLAGVGDTLFGVIWETVLGSVAAYMALQGNYFGVIIWIIAGLAKLFISKAFINIGYREGLKLVENIGGKLKNITEAANVLGLTVIGALIPTVVSLKTAYVYQKGDVTMELQGILDQIMPGLIPVALVAFVYWILGKKRMNSTKAIILLIVISIVIHLLGIA